MPIDDEELVRIRDLFTTVLLPYDLESLLDAYARAMRQRDHARTWCQWRTMQAQEYNAHGVRIDDESPGPLDEGDDDGWNP